MSDFIFVEHTQKDVFTYLVSLPDKNGEDHDLEVKIAFVKGELVEVQPPFGIEAKDTDLREFWQMQGQIAQMIENATRQIEARTRPRLDIDETGDVAPKTELVDKKDLPKGTFDDSNFAKKLSKEAVIKMRKHFRDPRHRNLIVGSEAERYGITGTSLSNALLGKTWAHVTEEPPLTVAEYDRAIFRPNQSARIYHDQD